jgi:hypothetical protein
MANTSFQKDAYVIFTEKLLEFRVFQLDLFSYVKSPLRNFVRN